MNGIFKTSSLNNITTIFMKYITLTAVIISLINLQCTSTKPTTKRSISGTQINFLTNYTVNPAPSGLDSVGIIFAVDPKGTITTIGNLNLKVNSDSVSVPQEVSTSNVSFKFLLDFLAIKNLDSTARAAITDTIKMSTKFVINTGVKSRFDPDINLLDAFNAKKSTIISNIKFLSLQKSRLYLIIEAIKSTEVNLSNIRNSNFSFDATAKFKQLVKLNPEVNISNVKNNSLVYSTNTPRVIFYKLRPIEVDIIKGPNTEKFELSLGLDPAGTTLY